MPEPDASKPRALTAEELLEVADLEVVPVEVPEWKGTVYLRVLPADVGLELNEKMQALPKDNQAEAMFLLLSATLCDADGELLIKNDFHRKKLRTRSTKVLVRLQRRALELQGWGQEGAAKNA